MGHSFANSAKNSAFSAWKKLFHAENAENEDAEAAAAEKYPLIQIGELLRVMTVKAI